MGDQTTVTVGVDTHSDVHVTVVLDHTGRLLDTRSFPTTTRGFAQLATEIMRCLKRYIAREAFNLLAGQAATIRTFAMTDDRPTALRKL